MSEGLCADTKGSAFASRQRPPFCVARAAVGLLEKFRRNVYHPSYKSWYGRHPSSTIFFFQTNSYELGSRYFPDKPRVCIRTYYMCTITACANVYLYAHTSCIRIRVSKYRYTFIVIYIYRTCLCIPPVDTSA